MTNPADVDIVGRDDELAALDEFLSSAESLPAVLLIRGEAGIGKTTLWEHALRAAGERSFRVLTHRAAAAEVQLAYAALGDLLRDVIAEALIELPKPQRRGLEVALLLAEAGDRPPEPQAIAAGFLSALSRLAEAGPLLLAVDDVQWLDPSSATTLAFALRRLGDQPIAVVLAERVEGPGRLPLGLDRDASDTRRLEVGPLTLGALHHLLTRIGARFARPTLRRLYEVSGGNPFFALELARELQRRGMRLEPGEPWPLPTDLHELLGERLSALPPPTREALLVASALARPTVTLVEQALDSEGRAVLQPAVDAHVISLDGDAIRFSHPLVSSAVYADTTPRRRRRCHLRLSAVVPDLEESARHLALGSDAPDEKTAAALEEAAQRAAGRGAPAVALELQELAVALTPASASHDAVRRQIDSAQYAVTAGEIDWARDVLETLTERLGPGDERADALLLLAQTTGDDEGAHRALCEQVLAEATRDAQLAEAHRGLAVNALIQLDGPRALAHAEAAVEVAERVGDPSLLIRVLGAAALAETCTGRSTPGLLERAIEFGQATGAESLEFGPSQILGTHLEFQDQLDAARSVLEEAYAKAVEHGVEFACPPILFELARVELHAGNWLRSERHLVEGLEQAQQLGFEQAKCSFIHRMALLDAHRGRVEEARTGAAQSLDLSGLIKDELHRIRNEALLGFLELSLGNAVSADHHLAPLPELLASRGFREPGHVGELPDAIEAAIAVGDRDRARALIERLGAQGRELDIPAARAAAARGRGLLLATEGDLEGALEELDRALVEHERSPRPFERARTLLALGQTRRRAKEKRAARESLEAALAIFEELGARLWAEKARAELARISGRAPTGGLTATEQRIAELVAEGRSNKEIAAALFVTVKTVERNLSRIYEKLGIRSRTELTRRFAEEQITQITS